MMRRQRGWRGWCRRYRSTFEIRTPPLPSPPPAGEGTGRRSRLCEVFWIETFEFFHDESSVFSDQFIVEVHFSAAYFGGLAHDQVPVDGAFISVAGFVVAGAGGEVDGAGN